MYIHVPSIFSFTPDMEDHQYLDPLLTRSTSPDANTDFVVPLPNDVILGTKQVISSGSSTRMIILRLITVVLIGCISLWASNEVDKGFHVTILNDAGNSVAGRRFHLLYASNNRATRLILEASQLIETLLYPAPSDSTFQNYRKKHVDHVTLRLASQNLTQLVTVDSYDKEAKFLINLSPSIMEGTNIKGAMIKAIGQGMARVWIFDNCHNAPSSLINGLVDYISSSLAPIPAEMNTDYVSEKSRNIRICWKDENPKTVARFLRYCEEHNKGFVRRLNQAMSLTYNWHDWTVDDALGEPSHHLCSSYVSRELLISNTQDSSLEIL